MVVMSLTFVLGMWLLEGLQPRPGVGVITTVASRGCRACSRACWMATSSSGGWSSCQTSPRHPCPTRDERGACSATIRVDRAISEVTGCPARRPGPWPSARAGRSFRLLHMALQAGNCVGVNSAAGGPHGGGEIVGLGGDIGLPPRSGTRALRHGQPGVSSAPHPPCRGGKTLATRQAMMHCTLWRGAPIWSRSALRRRWTISEPPHGPHGFVQKHLEPLLLTGGERDEYRAQ
ncbi:hypothetical protein GWK47_037735 [Chionoecetes opilio]|uniref:Uncharacterized protein n=1 Tax=Chionoecetes opilio TaxID=41210 RepID=A0A8J5CZ58_CHIOP|nr:hypothetical protein GWK47_037735 [Chionoecetes opilio]